VTSSVATHALALHALLAEAADCPAHELPHLLNRHAAGLGARDAMVYLADLQQGALVPFEGYQGPNLAEQPQPLAIDATVAGRAYRSVETLSQEPEGADGGRTGRRRIWVPLTNGAERLGVLAVTPDDEQDEGAAAVASVEDGSWDALADALGQLVVSRMLTSDTLVGTRRMTRMGLAAEVQWSLLPPLTFATPEVSIAAGLEPAYDVAGDSVDWAVDPGTARFAVFDGMGHGLTSALLATLVVAAYRNARRAGMTLTEQAEYLETAVHGGFGGEAFCTAVLGELDTDTGVFSWVSAGHFEPLLMRDGRLVRPLAVAPLLPFGLATDLEPTPEQGARPIRVGTESLEPGDLLLLYTDGVVEARSPDGEFFGRERLVDLVVRNTDEGLNAAETMRRVVHALLDHQAGDLDDDATLLLVGWNGRERA